MKLPHVKHPKKHALFLFAGGFFLLALIPLAGCRKDGATENSIGNKQQSLKSYALVDELLASSPAYAEAKAAMDSMNWDVATDILETLLNGEDPHPAYANDLGIIELQLAQPDRALAAFETALSMDPGYERAHYNRGIALGALARFEEAETAYRKALDINKFYYEASYNLGLLLYQQDRLDEAREAFLSVSDNTRASRFNRVLYQLGLIAADTGDDAEAIKYYEESLLLDPTHVPSYINKAAALLRLGELSASQAVLDTAFKLAPDDYRIFWNSGLIALQSGDADSAKAAFEKVLELEPGYVPALFNLGLSAFREGTLEKAREYFHKAAYSHAVEPYPEAHYMLGKTYSEQKQFNAAINEYEVALRLNPDYMEAAYNLALNLDNNGDEKAAIDLYKQLSKREDAPAEALNNLAAFYLSENQEGEAIRLLERAVKADPLYSTAAYNLGLAHLRMKAYAPAVAAFEIASELDPGNFAIWKNLGIAHSRLDALEPALDAMARAFHLNPSDADTAVYVVKYLKLLKRPEARVTEIYRKAFENGARNTLMLRHLANVAMEEKDYDAAVRYYEEYIRFRPTPVNFYNLGLAKLRKEDYTGAIESFDQATQLEPSNFAYWKNLGIAHAWMETYEPALAAMQRAFELNPADADAAVYIVKYLKLLDRPEATITSVYEQAYAAGARDTLILRHLAREAMDRDDYAASANYYADYVELSPSPVYYYNLGLALRKAERFSEALEAYKQAIELRPDYDKAWVNLGYIHAFLGDDPSAEAAFMRALEISPDYDNAKMALAELRDGTIQP